MKEKPEVIQFADDRPMSLDDDLYQWAIDAESLIRDLQSRLEELNQKVEELEKENASLKQDAARYRALRDSDEVFIRYSDGVDIHFVESTDQLDRLADAAMQANSQ